MGKTESNHYIPSQHGNPEEFALDVRDNLKTWGKDRTDTAYRLRRSSLLTAAFSPMLDEFRNRLNNTHTPETLVESKKDIGVLHEQSPIGTDIRGIFRGPLRVSVTHIEDKLISAKVKKTNHGEITTNTRPRLAIPRGEYDSTFYKAVVLTSSMLGEVAHETMLDYSTELLEGQYSHAINRDTYMAAPATTLSEGFQSIGASLGLLAHHKREGFDDPIELVKSLQKDDIFQQFAAHLPPGIVVPMSLNSYVFDTPLTKNAQNTWRIHPDLIDQFRLEKKFKVEMVNGYLSQGCPVARHNMEEVFSRKKSKKSTALSDTMDLFIPYLSYIYEKVQRKATTGK